MKVISNPKFRYLLVIYFLSTEFLLLTEEFVGAMEKKIILKLLIFRHL